MSDQIKFLFYIIGLLLVSFILSSLLNKLIIYIQNKRKVYQPLREELLDIHKGKTSTPTLGGIGIYLSSIISILIFNFNYFFDYKFFVLFLFSTGFFLIGLVDDLTKVIKKDHHGEKGSIRIILELSMSFLLLYTLGYSFNDFQYINFFDIHIFLGIISIFFLSFVIVGTSNAMNLVDGLDGLCSTLFILMLLPFAIYAFKNNHYEIGSYMISVFGSILGFIIYNIHPSKLFMGDSGSLYLGSFIAIISVIFHLEYILLISGIVLIIETLSVIIQVISFKLFKRRVFLMSPIHHHFELMGISEDKIVLIFIIVGYIASFISMLIII